MPKPMFPWASRSRTRPSDALMGPPIEPTGPTSDTTAITADDTTITADSF